MLDVMIRLDYGPIYGNDRITDKSLVSIYRIGGFKFQ
jgi:hypothetical protein